MGLEDIAKDVQEDLGSVKLTNAAPPVHDLVVDTDRINESNWREFAKDVKKLFKLFHIKGDAVTVKDHEIEHLVINEEHFNIRKQIKDVPNLLTQEAFRQRASVDEQGNFLCRLCGHNEFWMGKCKKCGKWEGMK